MADAAADASEHETLVRDMSKVLKDIADMLRANKEEFSASVFARSQDLDEEDIRTALRVLEAIGNGGAPAVAKKKKTKEIQLMSTKEELAAIVAQIKAEAQHYRSTMANKPIVGENISLTMADADLCEPLTKELFMARCAKFNAAQDATTISSKVGSLFPPHFFPHFLPLCALHLFCVRLQVASAIAGLFFIRCHQQNQESLHKIAEANGIDKKYIYRCAGFFNLVQAFPFLLVCRITFYKIDQFKPALVKAAKGDPELLSALQERPPAIKTSVRCRLSLLSLSYSLFFRCRRTPSSASTRSRRCPRPTSCKSPRPPSRPRRSPTRRAT